MSLPSYALTVQIPRPFAAAVQDLRAALEGEGLAIVWETDLQHALQLPGPAQQLLGVWPVALASAMVQAEPQIASLLPLGVLAVEVGPQHTHVAMQDPLLIAAQTSQPEVRKACKAVYTQVRRVVDRLMLGPPITF